MSRSFLSYVGLLSGILSCATLLVGMVLAIDSPRITADPSTIREWFQSASTRIYFSAFFVYVSETLQMVWVACFVLWNIAKIQNTLIGTDPTQNTPLQGQSSWSAGASPRLWIINFVAVIGLLMILVFSSLGLAVVSTLAFYWSNPPYTPLVDTVCETTGLMMYIFTLICLNVSGVFTVISVYPHVYLIYKYTLFPALWNNLTLFVGVVCMIFHGLSGMGYFYSGILAPAFIGEYVAPFIYMVWILIINISMIKRDNVDREVFSSIPGKSYSS